jgi:hypothetical protein
MIVTADNTPNYRPTMQELFDRASLQDGRRVCRRCGCADFRVVSTWHLKNGVIRRQRVCRHCGQDGFVSSERPDQ